MWKSIEELRTILSKTPNLPALDDAFALSRFWRSAVYPAGYMAHASWCELLVLNDSAIPVLGALRKSIEGVPDPDAYLAIFASFFYHDLLIDWVNSDLAGIRQLLDREIREGRIHFPHRFGRLLYDRFNDTDSHGRTDHIDHSEVMKLVAGTPQGVYQVNRFVSGPLGIFEASEIRYFPPSLSVPLWHCSDTGCKALHHVNLRQEGVLWRKASKGAAHEMTNEFGPRSEWAGALSFRIHDERWPEGREYYDLPAILGDCVIGTERTAILARAIRGPNGSTIRTALASTGEGQKNKGRSPEELAASLGAESQFQLLLQLKDAELVRLVDESVEARFIPIPLGEVRSPSTRPPKRTRDTESELSSLGLQSCRTPALVNLVSLIISAYTNNNLLTDLAWRIRAGNSSSISQSLMQYIGDKEPEDLVSSLVLPSQVVTNYVCADRQIDYDSDIPTERFVAKLLWKMGFNPPQFGDFEKRFQNRLREFNEVLLVNTPVSTEDQRELIRSAGVNLFVSVEEFLENLLVYNLWLLASDHFVDSRFRFNSREACEIVGSVLGASVGGDGTDLAWNPRGDNTLGVSLRYLDEAVKWMKGLEAADRDPLLRPESELPHFVVDRRLVFPYRHKALWADCDPTALKGHTEDFGRVVKLLAQSNLANVRNGLDHRRAEASFPTGDVMFACVARLREAFEIADVKRLYPKLFWLHKATDYQSGTSEFEVKDYAGRITLLFGPDLAVGHPAASFGEPFLVCPGSLLSVPNADIIFRLAHWNEYTRYWQGYPRRRHVPPTDRRESLGEAFLPSTPNGEHSEAMSSINDQSSPGDDDPSST